MTHDEIEQYLKDKDLNTFEYQLAMDAMLFAEQKTIEKACDWIKNNKHSHKVLVLSFGSLSVDWNKFIKEFRKDMEL